MPEVAKKLTFKEQTRLLRKRQIWSSDVIKATDLAWKFSKISRILPDNSYYYVSQLSGAKYSRFLGIDADFEPQYIGRALVLHQVTGPELLATDHYDIGHVAVWAGHQAITDFRTGSHVSTPYEWLSTGNLELMGGLLDAIMSDQRFTNLSISGSFIQRNTPEAPPIPASLNMMTKIPLIDN